MFTKFEKEKIKKLISSFHQLETSKIYMLQETDINNKN